MLKLEQEEVRFYNAEYVVDVDSRVPEAKDQPTSSGAPAPDSLLESQPDNEPQPSTSKVNIFFKTVSCFSRIILNPFKVLSASFFPGSGHILCDP